MGMAEVEEQNNSSSSSSGIKLFGKTICIKERSEVNGENGESSDQEKRAAIAVAEKMIPCPRCKSMETKFCYFNNYNVNQPRHFCRACHRYWTAGGALRNVPFGAGRRKTKPAPPPLPLSEGCTSLQESGGVEEHGGLGPAKRRRCAPNSQTCL